VRWRESQEHSATYAEPVLVETRKRKSDGDGGLMSDLIKQEKQVRRGRFASANPTDPRTPEGHFVNCADLMFDRNA
jgi:hypothetical protein